MSHLTDGSFACDRCGADIGNGDITHAIVVGDLDPDREGHVRNLHFCRENGCAGKVLSARNMAAYKERKEPDA